jgi:hypothetical protein
MSIKYRDEDVSPCLMHSDRDISDVIKSILEQHAPKIMSNQCVTMTGLEGHAEFRSSLTELLAVRAAQKLGELGTLPEDRLSHYKELAAPLADAFIAKVEHRVLVHEVKELIIKDAREASLRRTKLTVWLEYGINADAFVSAILLSIIAFVVDPATEYDTVRTIACIALLIVALQLIGAF